jgi:hypothetical protein
MPFATSEQVSPLVNETIRKELDKEGAFERFESSAAIIIREKTGQPIPADADDAPDWTLQPTAWIISYLVAMSLRGNLPDGFLDAAKSAYSSAMDFLKTQKIAAPRSGAKMLTGIVDSTYNNEAVDA